MKSRMITVEIPDEEIRDAILMCLVKDAVKTIETDLWQKSWGTTRYMRIYDKAIAEAVRGLLKEHFDNITEIATNKAAKSIENRGIKKLMEEIK